MSKTSDASIKICFNCNRLEAITPNKIMQKIGIQIGILEKKNAEAISGNTARGIQVINFLKMGLCYIRKYSNLFEELHLKK